MEAGGGSFRLFFALLDRISTIKETTTTTTHVLCSSSHRHHNGKAMTHQ
jgi:hypothetical protein